MTGDNDTAAPLPSIRRGYLNIGGDDAPRLVHYYSCGRGPVVFMLHPSPASGAVFLPVLRQIGHFATAIAIDTPGYGQSDPLLVETNDLGPFVDALEVFRDRMNIEEVVIYGSATGSQIALEYSKRFPNTCRSIVLDNIADFPAEERNEMLEGYFPDLSADFSGAHLTRIWTMSLDLMRFFPWHMHGSEDARLPARDIDPEVVQGMVLQFLQAGSDYDKAYRVAFMNENAERIFPTKVPTTIIRSSGSVVRRYADRFDKCEFSDNIRMHHCGPSNQERQQAIVDVIVEQVKNLRPVTITAPKAKTGRQIIEHVFGSVSTTLTPKQGDDWLMLHDIGSSSRAIEPITSAFARQHRVIAPDLPGHGGSGDLGCLNRGFIETSTQMLSDLLDCVAAARVKVLAVGSAAAVAVALSQKHHDRVSNVYFLNPVRNALPIQFTPKLNGTHLLTIWHQLRNAELYWPPDEWSTDTKLSGVPDLDPDRINSKLTDLLQCRLVYGQAQAEVEEILHRDLSGCDFVAALTRDRTIADRSLRSFRNEANVTWLDLPTNPIFWSECLDDWEKAGEPEQHSAAKSVSTQ